MVALPEGKTVPDISDHTILIIMLAFDFIVALVVPLEFAVSEIRHRRAKTMDPTIAVVPPLPRLRWPFLALAAVALTSTFTYLVYVASPRQVELPPDLLQGHPPYVVGPADSYFDGRPLGIWWNLNNLEVMSSGMIIPNKPPINQIAAFELPAKNLGNNEVKLVSAVITSAVDGTQLPMLVASADGPIKSEEAAPVPPQAEFSFRVSFVTDFHALSEEQFLRQWSGFYVQIQTDTQKIRHYVSPDDIRVALARYHPELRPHVTKAKP